MTARARAAALLAGAAALTGCGGATEAPPEAAPVAARTVEVTMPLLRFAPRTLTIRAGDTASWRNTSAVTHNVKGRIFFSRVIEPRQSYRRRFDEPGRYPYRCTFHPGMDGVIVVRRDA
jgi:plastocyanin